MRPTKARKDAPKGTPRLAVERKEYFARGKRGIASLASVGGKRVLVKERNPAADVDTIAHEAEMLKAVNKAGVGPLFIALQDNMLIREFIDGEEVMDWIPHSKKQDIKRVLSDVLAQCRKLDEIGVNKLEMTHPHKHILVRMSHGRPTPVMIDFDRSRVAQRPKNVTQVCQWLTGKEMATALSAKGIIISREAILRHAQAYKKQYSKIPYEHMLEVISNA